MAAPPQVFDHALIAARLARRAEPVDFVTALVLDDLAERLATISRSFERALIMAPDARALPAAARTAAGPIAFDVAATHHTAGALALDPEALVLPHTDYDLIVSVLDLQAINDVPGFLARIRQHLRPDGLFLGAALGGASLTQLRQAFLVADAEHSGGAFGRVAPFIDVRDAGALLQRAGFALPVADIETHTVRYSSPIALMAELKTMGAANPLADRPGRLATPKLLAAASAAYADLASDPDGRVRATLEIVWMSGWAPAPTQQKPLAPGSATMDLRSVLKDKSVR